MPEDNPQDGVKVETSEATPAPENPVATVNPPAEEHSVPPKQDHKGFVPYARFQEVNTKYRTLESEFAKFKADQLASRKAVSSENDQPEYSPEREAELMSNYAKRLEEKGLDPKASSVLADVIKEIAKDEAKSRYAKEESKRAAALEAKNREASERQAQAAKDVESWQKDFRKSHPDYEKYEPLMQKKWESLDQGARMALVSSPASMELLYDAVKGGMVEQAKAEGEEAGRSAAYETKNLKTALSSLPGTTAQPNKKFTAEDVAKMSAAEYTANRAKILSDLGIQQ